MKKRDLLTPIGLTLGVIMISAGILSNGGREGFITFIDFAAVLIVLGGVIGSLFINFKFEQMKLFWTVFRESFRKNEQSIPELIQLFVHLSERARKEGLLALEDEMEEVEDEFIKKGILLAIDGIEPEVINEIMEAEILALEDRHYKGRILLEKAGEYAPAWGMIGTLIGLVLMLNNLDDPSSIGPSMAVAIITTFYGAVLANLVFLPMAGKLEMKTEEEVFIKQIIIEGIIGVQSGQNPRILEEKLSAFLYGQKDALEKLKSVQEGEANEA